MSSKSIIFNNEVDKAMFIELNNNIKKNEAIIHGRVRFVTRDLAKVRDCHLPQSIKQNKINYIFHSLDPATQALQMLESDTDSLDSLFRMTDSRSRQNTHSINDKRRHINIVSEALAFSIGDLWHTFNSIEEGVNKDNKTEHIQSAPTPSPSVEFKIEDNGITIVELM